MDLLVQLLIGIVPAIASGVISYLMAKNKAEADLKLLKQKSENEIEKIKEESDRRIAELKEQRKSDLEYYKGQFEIDDTKQQNQMIYNEVGKFMGKAFAEIDSFEKLDELANKHGRKK